MVTKMWTFRKVIEIIIVRHAKRREISHCSSKCNRVICFKTWLMNKWIVIWPCQITWCGYYFFLHPNQLSNFLGFQVTLEGDCYHKTCFRCAHGGCHLTHSSYAALDGNLYCKHHFAQLFMVKGNYHHVLQAAAHKKNGATPPAPPADSEPKPEPESNVQEQSS